MFRLNPDGRETLIRLAHPGCLECLPLLDGGPNHLTAQAIIYSETYLLPRKDFLWLLREEPLLAQQISHMLATKWRYLLNRFGALSGNLESRVGQVLVSLAEPDEGTESVVPLSQEELACVAGVSRQRLNMYLSKLEKQGIIRKHRREISIIKPNLLEKSVKE